MSDYSQPDFYRFNEDSTFLIKFVKDHFQCAKSILDLGAGCGILGIELANHFRPGHLVLVEFQKDFIPFLDKNLSTQLKSSSETFIAHKSFGSFRHEQQFDLIVSNPPYYLKGKGEVSKDLRRANSRSFQHEGWKELLASVERSLTASGKAFLIIKNLPDIRKECERHCRDLKILFHPFKSVLVIELSRLDKNGS